MKQSKKATMCDEWGRITVLYRPNWSETLLGFPDALRLKIDDAIKRFALYGEEPTDPEIIYSLFGIIRTQIIEDRKGYKERCNTNREIIKEYWARVKNDQMNNGIRSNTNEYERIRTNTNENERYQYNVREDNIREDNKKELSIESKKKGTAKRTAFVVPALHEVDEYFTELGNTKEGEKFYDHFAANGWRTGKNPLRDWKAAARNWVRRSKEFTPPTLKTGSNERQNTVEWV